MKYLPYILHHLRRNWIRTGSTILAMSLCIFLFCTLQTFSAAVSWGLKSASASRLVTRHAVSLIFRLPVNYEAKIAAIPGVRSVAIRSFFGGIYRDPKNFFSNLAIEADPYLAMSPEFVLAPDQKQAFMDDMRGCIVGPALAKRFGWKLGDVFQMESYIPYYRVGQPFEFVVRGIYTPDEVRQPGTNDAVMFFHHRYLEAMINTKTNEHAGAGMFLVELVDPAQTGAITKQIDALFANSGAETKTETEAAFRAGLVSLSGNLALLLNSIGLAVTFTILLVTANTMSMAVRERRTEIAVLKTLGFSSARVMGLVLAEGAVLGAAGGGLGILFGREMIKLLPRVPLIGEAMRGLPNMGLSPALATLSFAVALSLGLAAGLVPALLAYRARITEMLRQI
jgi:putative ABC transport system permease protein